MQTNIYSDAKLAHLPYRKAVCKLCPAIAAEGTKTGLCITCYRENLYKTAKRENVRRPCSGCQKPCYSKYDLCMSCRIIATDRSYPRCSNCSSKMSTKTKQKPPICKKCRMANPEWHPNYNPSIPEEQRANPVSNRLIQKGYIEWRIAVLARYESRCAKCSLRQSRENKLDCHHIMNYRDYPSLRVDPENGIPLCKPCHKEFHTRFGIRNNNAEQLRLFIGVTVADLPAAAAGNAGSIQYVTDANATTIGSTVAGGGANKVMVWSDGAAWKIFAS